MVSKKEKQAAKKRKRARRCVGTDMPSSFLAPPSRLAGRRLWLPVKLSKAQCVSLDSISLFVVVDSVTVCTKNVALFDFRYDRLFTIPSRDGTNVERLSCWVAVMKVKASPIAHPARSANKRSFRFLKPLSPPLSLSAHLLSSCFAFTGHYVPPLRSERGPR